MKSGISKPVNPTKEQIKTWLKAFGHSREWLGEQCGNIKPRTVDNWLSSPQVIPDATLSLIGRLIADDEAAERLRKQKMSPASQVFSLEVELETYRAYSRAALAAGLTLEDWAVKECNKAAKIAAPRNLSLVAEEPGKSSHSTPAPGVVTKYPTGKRRKPDKKA